MDDHVYIAQSSVADGPFPLSRTHEDPNQYRSTFLHSQSIQPGSTTLVFVDYNRTNFCEYRTVDVSNAGNGITQASQFSADALFTRSKNLALFLQLADCVGAVLYDPEHDVLGLSHLGRHNLEQNGGQKIIEYMKRSFGSNPKTIEVFLSAAAGKERYPLFDFDNRSLHEETTQQLLAAGVSPENIKKDPRDTTNDMALFSHSEFLKGNREIDGRFAMVVMIKN